MRVADIPKQPARAEHGLPSVSVIVPCRNEESYIGACLDSIIANDYPHDRLEVLVVDGMSDDATSRIVDAHAARCRQITRLKNKKRITPAGLNIGLRRARGHVVIRMDAHACYPPDYISALVTWLLASGADNVGGVLITEPSGSSALARAIAIAVSHPFGVGNAYFRIGAKEPRWVDTVPFGCYRREVFKRIGGFDEELVRNQDDELNHRLIKQGGRILLVPSIVARYRARSSLQRLWTAYFEYGYFKPLVARKLGGVFTARQVVPVLFLTTLLVTCVLAPVSVAARAAASLTGGSYLLGVFGWSLHSGARYGPCCVAWLCVAFPSVHVGYGAGYMKGLLDFVIRRRLDVKRTFGSASTRLKPRSTSSM